MENETLKLECKKLAYTLIDKIEKADIKDDEISDMIFDFLNKNSTDTIFSKLPSMISLNGDYYHFYLFKGTNRINVGYRMNAEEGGKDIYNTYRTGKTITEALINMRNALIEWKLLEQNSNILLDMVKHSQKLKHK